MTLCGRRRRLTRSLLGAPRAKGRGGQEVRRARGRRRGEGGERHLRCHQDRHHDFGYTYDKFLDYITDPAGRQTLTLTYYAKGDTYSYIDANGNVASGTNLTNPKIIDQVKAVTGISGRTLTFLYTVQGLMAQMTDGSGSTVKTFKFGYDMTQGNKNVKLVSVTDPRDNATNLAYYTAPQDPKFKWSLLREAKTAGISDGKGAWGSFSGVGGGGSCCGEQYLVHVLRAGPGAPGPARPP